MRGHQLNGAELRRQCAIHGLPYQELARDAGVSPATISHALSGRPISTATLRAIAAALGRRELLPRIDALLSGPAVGEVDAAAPALQAEAASGDSRAVGHSVS